jgi:Ca2+-binding RTX toxin-like protein
MAQTTNPEALEYGEPPAFAGAQDLTATQFTQDSGSPAILGHVRNLTGEVFLVRRDGTRVRLQEGDQVHQGESVETATGAAAGIELADGSRFALGGETRLALGTDLFDPSVGVGEATYAVLSGTFRFESAGGDGEPVTIVTPDATVTLRDGSIAGQSAGAGQGHWLTLRAGAADVRTRAGSVSLTQAGETTVIAGADAPPTAPFVVSGSDLTAVYGGIAGISDDLAGSLNDIATAAGGDPNDPPPPDPGPATPPPAPLPAAFDTGTPFTAPQFAEAPPEAPAPTAGNDTDPPVAAALPPGDKDPGTDDILIGTADSDVLSGGNGNDTLDGLGESDALFGGPGNDRLVFDPADSVIDGGPGTDTLVVTGDGTILNAATLANVHSIEAIELAGSGNVLSLSADLVRSLSPTGTLTVSAGLGGNALAGVTEGEWRLLGQLAGGDTNFRVFANESDTATLLVEQKVAITDLISREALQTRVDRFSGGNTRIVGEASGDYSGFSVSVAGDVNGDGIDDLIVGARNNHSGGAEDGSAYVVFGSSDRLAEIDLGEIARGTGGFKILGDYNGTAGGSRVSNAGDINGDGLDDIILGVPNSHSSHGDTGAAYVIFGRSDYLAPVRLEEIAEGQGGFRIIGARNLDFAGASVSSAGDFNGDGIGDVILGAFQFDSQFPLEGTDVNVTATNAGAAFIVFGSSDERATIDLRDLVSESNGIVLASETPSARAARSVSRAGDINGDGLDDVIVSVRNSGSPDGGAFVVFGTVAPTSGASLEEIAAGEKGSRIIPEPSNGAESDVSFAGDVNGDGIDDLIVGAYRSDANGTDSGVAYVVFGSREGFPSSVDLSDVASGTGGFKIIGEYSGDQAGISVAAAGDINGDGIDDLIIGANRNNAGGASAGAAYIVLGSTIFDATIDLHDIAGGSGGFKLLGTGLAGRLGESVSSAGDFDGDGIDDVIIGAPGLRTNGTVKSGGAFILYGFDQAVTEQITALGTSGDDTFAGTVSKDVIAGSLGDDTIFGNGGADVLLGGAGNDFFQVPSTDFAKIDGGIGVDRLHLEGGDLSFNLTSPDSPQLSGIVQIDLTGPGNISVTLTALEASSISDTGTLTIAGDTGDTVAALDLWNRLDDVDIEGQAHYHFEEPTGTTTLFIDQDITLEGLLSTRVASEAIDSFAGGGFCLTSAPLGQIEGIA